MGRNALQYVVVKVSTVCNFVAETRIGQKAVAFFSTGLYCVRIEFGATNKRKIGPISRKEKKCVKTGLTSLDYNLVEQFTWLD
jgi:hypothetical protein